MINLSASNDKIKYIKKLARKREREKNGEFVIEGTRAVTDAINNGAEISFVILREAASPVFDPAVPQFSTDGKTFAEITDTESPQDMLAVAKARPAEASQIISGDWETVVLCDRVQDPGNIGTIIRTADAVGNAAVILSSGCADLYNPKVIRSTMSSVFNIPVAKDADLNAVIAQLSARGFKIICGALSPTAVDLYDANFSGKCAIIIGNEGSGVSQELISLCDTAVKIPMRGKAESLNASVSAGILMYEVLRHNKKA